MAEGIKARLRVVSRMVDPQGERYETKHARKGVLLRTGEALLLEYDDEQDGERAHIILSMKPGKDQSQAVMQRKGMTSGTLTFAPGKRTSSAYVTLYGDIPIQIDTRSVVIEDNEDGGMLRLDYDVYMGMERTSSAQMEIAWRL